MTSTPGILCILLISSMIYIGCARENAQNDQIECPPWFFYNTETKTCKCYSNPTIDHIVRCTEKEVLLKLGYCMTYEEKSGFSVNLCDSMIKSLNITKYNYIRLPSNVSDLNDYMCGPMNRQGPMCGQCNDGFGLAVFSIGNPCTNCTGIWYGVPLYLIIEFVPITIFYFIIILFHVNVTSAPMVAFILFSQIAVSAFSTLISNRLIFSTSVTYRFVNILISFYGIWNLDFFRFIMPPFCVSPLLKPIHITFLYFISAIYPLCLIIMTWTCIHLYSRNFKPIVWLWNKLIQKFCNCFSTNWSATNKVIDAFATFFLLSYTKLALTSLRTLNYYGITYYVNMNQSLYQIPYVKPDPTMKYFGKEHLPFAITSIFIVLFVVLPIPLLLALYPIESIRAILFKCPIGSRTAAAINIFVQKFYNCYRDKTDGGRDMRSLVSMYFFLRVLNYLVTANQIPLNVSFSIALFIYLACSILIALVRPYRQTYMNIADTLILTNLALLSLVLSQLSGELATASAQFFYISGSILTSLPLLGLTGVIIYKIIGKIAKLPCCKRLLRLYQRSERNDMELDYDQLIVASREDSELQECTSVKQQNDTCSSDYIRVS